MNESSAVAEGGLLSEVRLEGLQGLPAYIGDHRRCNNRSRVEDESLAEVIGDSAVTRDDSYAS